MKIEGVELTIYCSNGENISFDLSPAQTKGIITMLGITDFDGESFKCYSDDAVLRLSESLQKRIKLKEE